MTAIERDDLPYVHMTTWHCECREAGCEISTETDRRPMICPFGNPPKWRRGRC